MAEFKIESIGTYYSQIKNPAEAGRQPSLSHALPFGEIQLHPQKNFEQALIGLDGVERIWLLFIFHKNENWKPMVQPPRGDKKMGVFATRAPYRPNFIGLSCVCLKEVTHLRLLIEGADLLDGTPILDIKPYLPYSDSFPDSQVGWLADIEERKHYVTLSPLAEKQILWLEQNGLTALRPFLLNQLEYEPTNSRKKRVQSLPHEQYEIAYRTWRCLFQQDGQNIVILKINSGYSQEDLASVEDPYQDKQLHQNFLMQIF